MDQTKIPRILMDNHPVFIRVQVVSRPDLNRDFTVMEMSHFSSWLSFLITNRLSFTVTFFED